MIEKDWKIFSKKLEILTEDIQLTPSQINDISCIFYINTDIKLINIDLINQRIKELEGKILAVKNDNDVFENCAYRGAIQELKRLVS